jgi:hypothetical protein
MLLTSESHPRLHVLVHHIRQEELNGTDILDPESSELYEIDIDD